MLIEVEGLVSEESAREASKHPAGRHTLFKLYIAFLEKPVLIMGVRFLIVMLPISSLVTVTELSNRGGGGGKG